MPGLQCPAYALELEKTMHDGSDGCILILLSFGGAVLMTLFLFGTIMGDPMPPKTHHAAPIGLELACLGAWIWTVGVILVEAIHDQKRKRRR